MVLAEFLNAHLLEPQKRRLRAEGYAEGYADGYAEGRVDIYAEGRAKAIAEARLALQKAGLNLDDYLPPE